MAFGLETSDDLLAAVKRDNMLPATQITYSDSQILSIAYEQLISRMVPLLVSMNEGWYRTQVDAALTAGVATYVLPKYAVFLKIHDAVLVNNATQIECRLARVNIADRSIYGYGTPGFPNYVYLDHHHATLMPYPDAGTVASYSLRFIFYRMPGKLVQLSAAAKVLSVNKTNGQVTYTAVPPSTFTSSSTHDFYSSTPPFPRLQNSITATALAGAVQTFPVASVQTLNANDYVSIVDETVYPDIPYGLFTGLKDLTIYAITGSQMDAQARQEKEKDIMGNIKMILGAGPGNRFLSKPKKMSQYNNGILPTNGFWRPKIFP